MGKYIDIVELYGLSDNYNHIHKYGDHSSFNKLSPTMFRNYEFHEETNADLDYENVRTA
jgi:hypothetical protein